MGTKRSILIGRIVSTICLLILGAIWIMPLIWALGASFKPDTITDINQIFPSVDNWTFEWYQLLFTFDGDYPVLRWILNSFIVGCIHTVLYLIIVSFAAYALVFLDWKFKNAIFTVVVSSMMFPGIITLVPLYNLFNSLGIAGNPTWVYLIGCILPGLGGVFGLFLIRQFFLGLPKELVEACKVDGCNNFQIFFRVILPIGKNAIFVAAIFAFLGNWNDYLWPQLIASGGVDVLGREWLTLPVGLSVLVSGRTGDTSPLAGAVISAIPVMIVYLFAQKYIINGVSRSGIK